MSSATNSLPLLARIQVKTLFLLTVLLVLVTGGFTYLDVSRNAQTQQTGLRNFTDQLAQQLSQHLTLSLWVVDDEQVKTSARAAFLDERVEAVRVRNHENRVIAAFVRNLQGNVEAGELSPTDALLQASAQVTVPQQNDRIGTVEVFVTPHLLAKALETAYFNALQQLLVLVGVLVFVNTVVLRYLVVRPINQLARAADRISRGDLESAVQIKQNDEIGLLARAFERMRLSLKIMMQIG